MPAFRNISGTWKNVAVYRNISGTWKLGILWRKISGTWKQITSVMTASATPTAVGNVHIGGGTTTVTSDATTATPSGGTAPYTYAWSQTGGDSMTITSPTAASTTFSKSVPDAVGYEGYFVCVVTDNVGQVAATNTVTCTLAND